MTAIRKHLVRLPRDHRAVRRRAGRRGRDPRQPAAHAARLGAGPRPGLHRGRGRAVERPGGHAGPGPDRERGRRRGRGDLRRAARAGPRDRDAQARRGRRPGPPRRDACCCGPRPASRTWSPSSRPAREAAGELPEGERIPIGQTLPDVNLDEILAALDGDTRAYLVMLLLAAAREGLRGNGARAREHDPPLRAAAPRLAQDQRGARRRGGATSRAPIHNFSLLVEELGDKDDAAGALRRRTRTRSSRRSPSQEASLRATLRELPVGAARDRRRARPAPTRSATSSARRSRRCGPAARALGPALRADAAVPDRHDAGPPRRDPPVRARGAPAGERAAPGAPATSPRPTPDLVDAFDVVNTLFDALAYNPPGEKDEGYLFWASWVNHLGPALFSNADAHGPIRRGLVVASCQQPARRCDNVVLGNPQLGAAHPAARAPAAAAICPQTVQFPQPGDGG